MQIITPVNKTILPILILHEDDTVETLRRELCGHRFYTVYVPTNLYVSDNWKKIEIALTPIISLGGDVFGEIIVYKS